MVPRRAEVHFDCTGAAFSRVRASARVELFGNFWGPQVKLLGSFWEPVGLLFAISRAVGFGKAEPISTAVGSRRWIRSVQLVESYGNQWKPGGTQADFGSGQRYGSV